MMQVPRYDLEVTACSHCQGYSCRELAAMARGEYKRGVHGMLVKVE